MSLYDTTRSLCSAGVAAPTVDEKIFFEWNDPVGKLYETELQKVFQESKGEVNRQLLRESEHLQGYASEIRSGLEKGRNAVIEMTSVDLFRREVEDL